MLLFVELVEPVKRKIILFSLTGITQTHTDTSVKLTKILYFEYFSLCKSQKMKAVLYISVDEIKVHKTCFCDYYCINEIGFIKTKHLKLQHKMPTYAAQKTEN